MLTTLLVIATLAFQTIAQQPCGFKIAACPTDMVCTKNDPACTRGENCAGICTPGPYYNDMLPATPKWLHPVEPTAAPLPKATPTICGGRRKEQPCKPDEECVDKPETPGALSWDGPGICRKKVSQRPTTDAVPRSAPTYERKCGGMVPHGSENGCLKDEICIDDPRRPEGVCGLACDGPGVCVKPVFCGGFAGIRCHKMCIDDPRDDCDTKHGGADCGGICV